jgi:5-formyltetrahydrofolate cyclo-ligase
MDATRSALRTTALSRRASLSAADCLIWGRLIQKRAIELPQYEDAHSVGLYSPVQNEVNTNDIMEHALAHKKGVFYPRIDRPDSAGFYRILSAADLKVGRFGILEPGGAHPLSEADREQLIVFVPGVLFDPRGNRLGRGQGWYDRMLTRLDNQGIVVGLAYEVQIVAEMTAEEWDRKVHYIITENRVIDCGVLPQ